VTDDPSRAPRDAVAAAIRASVAKGRPALIGYLTAGFPTRSSFTANLEAVAGACDVVEIGVPFSDPMADGTTIQRASRFRGYSRRSSRSASGSPPLCC